MRVVTLTTDFGAHDWFVGAMKGVILGTAPEAAVVDLTHGIHPGDLRAGAFALLAGYRAFPRRTVHVVVVDPGVGGRRAAMAVETADYFFVGPDNGVLSWALARERIKQVRRLENDRFFCQPVSRTFHGRDIFAPVAAHLCRGMPFARLGPAQNAWQRLDWPAPARVADELQGEVVYVDRFGNAITNLNEQDMLRLGAGPWTVSAGRRRLCRVEAYYAAVPHGHPVALIGSSGLLEVAVRGGNAAVELGLAVGSRVRLRCRRTGRRRARR